MIGPQYSAATAIFRAPSAARIPGEAGRRFSGVTGTGAI